MALPKLSAQSPIVQPDRKPTSGFLEFMEQTRRAQTATDENQDQTDQALINLALTIAGILNGTIPFTELNVATNQVRAFLDKTSAGVLTDPTGLGAAVVQTDALELQAVTNQVSAFTSAQIDLSSGATSFTTLQEVNIVANGGRIELKGNFYLRALVGGGSFTDTVIIERYANSILSTTFSVDMQSAPITGADYIVGLQPIRTEVLFRRIP